MVLIVQTRLAFVINIDNAHIAQDRLPNVKNSLIVQIRLPTINNSNKSQG